MKRSRNKHVVVLLRLFYFFCFLEKSLPKMSVLIGIVVKGIKVAFFLLKGGDNLGTYAISEENREASI